MAHSKTPMREQVTATVQLNYECNAEDSLSAQSNAIHDDLTCLLTSDESSPVKCWCVTVNHVSSEAVTEGHAERGPSVRQSSQIERALREIYPVEPTAQQILEFALADLRHFADHNDLAFGLCDKVAHTFYRNERRNGGDV